MKMPAVDPKWGTLAKVGGTDKQPIESIQSHRGTSDGPSVGLSGPRSFACANSL